MNHKKHKIDKSFWNFLEFKGKKGRKDVIVLVSAYLFLLVCLLLISVFGENNIPIELTYVVLGLPFVFFGFAFIFWLLKRFFSFLYQRVSFIPFILICSFLFLIWNAIITWVFEENRFRDDNVYTFISFIFFLAVSSFVIGLMIWSTTKKIPKNSLKSNLIYILANVLIVLLCYYLVTFNDMKLSNILLAKQNLSEFANLYVTFLVIHLLIYSGLWIASIVKGFGLFLLMEGFYKIKK